MVGWVGCTGRELCILQPHASPHASLSTPQAEFNELSNDLARQYPDRARLWFAYDEPLRWALVGTLTNNGSLCLLASYRPFSDASSCPTPALLSMQPPHLRRLRHVPGALHVRALRSHPGKYRVLVSPLLLGYVWERRHAPGIRDVQALQPRPGVVC